MPKDVMIKGVDAEAYRRAKAIAALEGISMGRAVSEALARWTEGEAEVAMAREHQTNLELVRRRWKEEFEPHRGKAVVVSLGRLQGVFESYDRACKFASRFRLALTFVVDGRPAQREIFLGPDLEIQQGA